MNVEMVLRFDARSTSLQLFSARTKTDVVAGKHAIVDAHLRLLLLAATAAAAAVLLAAHYAVCSV